MIKMPKQYTQQQMIDFSIIALIFVAILTVYVMLSYLIELKNVKFIHQSTVAIIMGIFTAIFCKFVSFQTTQGLKSTISFSNEIFFAIILPPIIFSAGFSLRKKLFFQNFGLICFYGIIGTILEFILITLALLGLNRIIFGSLNLSQIMIVACVLCATDTVSSMTLIKAQKHPILNSVLFGQSILNDAVAIILFRAVAKYSKTKDEQFGLKIMGSMALSFFYLFFFSMILGIISGLFLSYLFRRFSFFARHPIKQTSIVLLNGYFTYLLGQIFGLSGIITIFTQAIIIGHYAFRNLSEESKKGTGMAFETVSYIAEAFIYAYLGASILAISQNWRAVLIALALILCLPIIRGLMVYILPLFYKIFRVKFYLNGKQLKVCWFAGMIRGVIAFALCLQVETENRQFVTSLVLVVVLVTTVGGSSLLSKFVENIKLTSMPEDEQLDKNILNEEKDGNVIPEFIKQSLSEKKHKCVRKITLFQKKYMQPLFGVTNQPFFDRKISEDEEIKTSVICKQNNLNPIKSEQNPNYAAGIQMKSPQKTNSKSNGFKIQRHFDF